MRTPDRNKRTGVDTGGGDAGGGCCGAGEDAEVQLVPLSFVPGSVTVGVLGPLSLHLIKETWTLREEGGKK